MKMTKKLLVVVLVFVLTVTPLQISGASVKNYNDYWNGNVEELLNRWSLSQDKMILGVGEAKQIYVLGTSKKATWKSSNKKIATVSKSGIVRAKKKGKATISVKIGSTTHKCVVQVHNEVSVWTRYTVQLKKGKTYRHTATVSPNTKANRKKLRWHSSDTSIATVDKNGKVKAKKKGYVMIIAKAGRKQSTTHFFIN